MTGLLVVGLCGAFVAGAVVYRVMMVWVATGREKLTAAKLDAETVAMVTVRRMRQSGVSEDMILAFGQAICALARRSESSDAT